MITRRDTIVYGRRALDSAEESYPTTGLSARDTARFDLAHSGTCHWGAIGVYDSPLGLDPQLELNFKPFGPIRLRQEALAREAKEGFRGQGHSVFFFTPLQHARHLLRSNLLSKSRPNNGYRKDSNRDQSSEQRLGKHDSLGTWAYTLLYSRIMMMRDEIQR